MRRPMIGLFLVTCAGTWTGLQGVLPDAWIAAVGVFSLLCVCGLLCIPSLVPQTARKTVVVVSLLLLSVFCVTAWRTATCSAVRFRNVVTGDDGTPAEVTVEADVRSDAVETRRSANGVCRRFSVCVESMTHAGRTLHLQGVVLDVDWWAGDGSAIPRFGQRLRLAGRIEPVRYGDAVADFRWTMVSGRQNTIVLEDHGMPSSWFRLEQARRSAGELLTVDIADSPHTVAVLHSILLGYRGCLDANLSNLFRDTGTVHIFAISGLHVGIIALLIVTVVGFAGFPRASWPLATIPLLILYTLATGARPSAVRACIMASLYLVALLVRRKPDTLSALAGAGVISLAIRPHDLVSAGFILSFSVVAGLIVLYPVLDRVGTAVAGRVRQGVAAWMGREHLVLPWEHDPFDAAPLPRGKRMVRSGLHYLKSLFVLSLAAWLVSAPLTAFYFGRLTLISILSNVVVIPMTFLIVLCGSLSLLTGAVWSGCAVLFNNANILLVHILIATMRGLASVSAGSIQIGHPPLWLVLLWYLGLAVLGPLVRMWRLTHRVT